VCIERGKEKCQEASDDRADAVDGGICAEPLEFSNMKKFERDIQTFD